MPTATLTFNLPEDQYAFDCAVRGGEYKDALADIYNHLRRLSKNSDTTTVADLLIYFGETVDINKVLE